MDVHPPHGSIHTWRDFFVHLSIITLGLLIALGLEGLVEWVHNRHLLHRAEANLRSELELNRATLINDGKLLDASEKQLQTYLGLLSAFKADHHATEANRLSWEWNGLSSAAWDTARNTGAVALMDYAAAQKYADIYTQQSLVDAQASAYIRDMYRSLAPLQGGRRLSSLQTTEVDSMVANVQQTMADLKFLRDLSDGLSGYYERNGSSQAGQ